MIGGTRSVRGSRIPSSSSSFACSLRLRRVEVETSIFLFALPPLRHTLFHSVVSTPPSTPAVSRQSSTPGVRNTISQPGRIPPSCPTSPSPKPTSLSPPFCRPPLLLIPQLQLSQHLSVTRVLGRRRRLEQSTTLPSSRSSKRLSRSGSLSSAL